jgi:nitrate reductase molybdenum cofactor assembly chaperone NarJ/NarW
MTWAEKQLIFKLCSIMLRYPDQAWVHNEEMVELVEELEDGKIRRALLGFLEYVQETSWESLTENYVRWFDLSESTTLYLTYGIFGDNRERGPAFVQLKMEFAKAGFYLTENELPDYLPLVLEFASIAEPKHVQKVLGIHGKAIAKLHETLQGEQNPYTSVLEAVLAAMAMLMPEREQNVNHNAS